MLWIKDSSGNGSAMLSFAVVGLLFSCFSTLLSVISSVKLGGVDIVFNKPDTTLILGILSATVGAYVIRRNRTEKYNHLMQMADKGIVSKEYAAAEIEKSDGDEK